MRLRSSGDYGISSLRTKISHKLLLSVLCWVAQVVLFIVLTVIQGEIMAPIQTRCHWNEETRLTAGSVKVWASRRFVVRLYRTSQVSLAGRLGQVRVRVNPRHILGCAASVFSQHQSRTAGSRGVILRQLTHIIAAKLVLGSRCVESVLSYR